MNADSIQGQIGHEVAELRAAFPAITSCETALVEWKENGQARYSLGLDIRGPQHQTLLSGPAQPTPEAAVAAAFRLARERLQGR